MTTLAGRKIYERHLDLLLAEELVCNPEFAQFLFAAAFGGIAELPDGTAELPEGRTELPEAAPASTTVTVSHLDDTGLSVGAGGENDLLVESLWADGRRYRLLVEDKLDAILQPGQVERYLERARRHGDVDGVEGAKAIVIAPDGYLVGKRADLKSIGQLSIEAIAQWFEKAAKSATTELAARLRWRAQHLVIFDEGRRLPAPELPEMVQARNRIVDRLAEIEPRARASSGMRSAGSGWLYFEQPASLRYKVVHGVIDIYLTRIWPDSPTDVDEHHQPGAGPEGFDPAQDDGGNPVLRCTVRPASATDRIRPIRDVDSAELDEGADACARATNWILALGSNDAVNG